MAHDPGQLKKFYCGFLEGRARLREYQRAVGGTGDAVEWAESLLRNCGDVMPEPVRRAEGKQTFEELLS